MRWLALVAALMVSGCGKSFTEADAIHKDEDEKLDVIWKAELARRFDNQKSARDLLDKWDKEHGVEYFIRDKLPPDFVAKHDAYAGSLVQNQSLGLHADKGVIRVKDVILENDEPDESSPEFAEAYRKQKAIVDKAWKTRESAKR